MDMKIKTDVIRLGKYLKAQLISRLGGGFGLCDLPVAVVASCFSPEV